MRGGQPASEPGPGPAGQRCGQAGSSLSLRVPPGRRRPSGGSESLVTGLALTEAGGTASDVTGRAVTGTPAGRPRRRRRCHAARAECGRTAHSLAGRTEAGGRGTQ